MSEDEESSVSGYVFKEDKDIEMSSVEGTSSEEDSSSKEKSHDSLVDVSNGATLSWSAIDYSVSISNPLVTSKLPWKQQKIPKKILHGVSGIAKPGELFAIMGPSGAGKTTLLDILSRRIHLSEEDDAKVLLNGRRRDSAFSMDSGYVRQEDVLLGTCTVRETLQFSADLRLPTSVSKEEKHRRVDELLADLDLTSIQHNRIGNEHIKGISGGEMKRVAVGIEVISKPKLIFLDEPTTGLDATMALNVLRGLKKLTQQGHTVICTIHQPRFEIFSMFDKLLLLARGHAVYNGSAKEAVNHFDKLGYTCNSLENPPDFFLDLLRERDEDDVEDEALTAMLAGKTPDERIKSFIEAHQDSEGYKELSRELESVGTAEISSHSRKSSQYQTGLFNQFKVLLQRDFQNSIRDPLIFWSQIAQYLILGLFLGFSYFQLEKDQKSIFDHATLLFSVAIYMSFVSGFTYIIIFPQRRKLFLRESASYSYSTLPFMASLTCHQLPVQFLSVLGYCGLIYLIAGLKSGLDHFLVFFFFNVLILLTSEAVSVSLSAMSTSADVANLLFTIVTTVWMFFTPVFINPDNIPDWLLFIPYTSFFKWTVDGLFINEFRDAEFTCDDLPCPIVDEYVTIANETIPISQIDLSACTLPCVINTGQEYLDSVDLGEASITTAALALVILLVAFKTCQYPVLRLASRKVR